MQSNSSARGRRKAIASETCDILNSGSYVRDDYSENDLMERIASSKTGTS